MMDENGYKIVNVDSLIMIEKPKMSPYIEQMRENIAKALECDKSLINVKATCFEGMGFVGEEKGAIAQAVVLIDDK